MSIERTMTVKRKDAIEMLTQKGCFLYVDDCNSRLGDLLYEYKESDHVFENYNVVDDDFEDDEYDNWKTNW